MKTSRPHVQVKIDINWPDQAKVSAALRKSGKHVATGLTFTMACRPEHVVGEIASSIHQAMISNYPPWVFDLEQEIENLTDEEKAALIKMARQAGYIRDTDEAPETDAPNAPNAPNATETVQ